MFVSKRSLTLALTLGIFAMVMTACERTKITRIVEEAPVGGESNCFECHSDAATFIVAAEQQWMNSVHASSLNIDRGASASCAGCHISEGFVQRASGLEVTGEDNATPIHCFTCHAPHTEGDFSLRWTEPVTLQNGVTADIGAGNLCAQCHQARRDVNSYVGTIGTETVSITSTHWGPHHGNQADMFIGSNGYEYAGYTYRGASHLSAATNGCVNCHFDATSNSVVGGHSFNMAYTLRDEGGAGSEILNTAACEACHSDVDDFDINDMQTNVNALIAELEELLEDAGLWTNGHPNAGVTTSVDSAGAVWNLLMAEEDRSHGVHNAKYTVDLLQSSIDFMKGELKGSDKNAVYQRHAMR